MSQWRKKWALALALAIGIGTGIGAYTFRYAEGLSYFSKDPRACANCHIMQQSYSSWQMAGHHTVAACADCHLPHETIAKYLAKADNGWRHSRAFTTGNFPEPLEMIPRSRAILEKTCQGCHEGLVQGMLSQGNEAPACLHCHSDVGHGERLGLGGPFGSTALEARQMPAHGVKRKP
ncbi:MAG: cytochrome c nitrite reductase small subunit [Polyangiaceae bacterium]|nr:cytochrome c nitrite reductase small subunit [Polyangiaceae bacterium]